METPAFKHFRARLFELYGRGARGEALRLLEEEGGAFPEFESDILFWRACLAGCTGDREGALAALRLAAERGYWYHERMLRDPDLDPIRDSEAMVELQRIFQERYQRAQAEARPQREVWEPAGETQGLLVVLHGAGGSIASEGPYWQPAVELGWRVAMLQSSQVWAPGRYHWQDVEKATQEVLQHLEQVGAAPTTVLAGFSMGGGLAVRLTLSGTVSARGFLAVAPAFRLEQMVPLAAAAPRDVRGYIVIGTQDWSYNAVMCLASELQSAGLSCAVEEYEGLDHDYPAEVSSSLRRGLAFLQQRDG